MSSGSHTRFINRELSWLEFNGRVLSEALRPDVPLLERLKFLCIVSSNLDGFYMVRVASVKRQIHEGDHVHCPSGIAPSLLLEEITARAKEIVAGAHACLTEEIIPSLAAEGLILTRPHQYSATQAAALRKLFDTEVFPVLTPIRVESGGEFPYTANLQLHAAFLVEPDDGADDASLAGANPFLAAGESLAVVRLPSSLDRLIELSAESGRVEFALLEDVIAEFAPALFPGYLVREHCVFRVNRDADLGVDEERDEDFVEAMRQVVRRRERSRPIRLLVSRGAGRLKRLLGDAMGLPYHEIFDATEPVDVGGLVALTVLPGFDRLRNAEWLPTAPAVLPEETPIWDILRKRDVLLHHPYESFDPVVGMVRCAATDPEVLSIKITLYRTSGDSPVVRALEQAAEHGKQVTAVVEIKARFDEEQNISWAGRLERAGVIVVYGIARLKVHAKALLIVRREEGGVTRYAHLGTGNYNDTTALLYTDFSLLTSRQEIVYELGLFFNAITGYSTIPPFRTLALAPVGLKPRILQLIERETLRSRSGEPGLILAKLNSLADPQVIEALYAASAAGVTVKLNVRGICMLRPGMKGVSENITVVSIVDRYLEHGRVILFQNGGAPEVYCSSADWMPRNLERRVELMFPIADDESRDRIAAALEAAFRDNTHAHLIGPDGRSSPVRPARGEKEFSSQHHHQLTADARAAVPLGENRSTFDVRRRHPEA